VAAPPRHDQHQKLPPAKEVYTEDQLWEAFTWLIERITPVCESKGQDGVSSNDPTVFVSRFAQIVNPAAYRRLLYCRQPYNGVILPELDDAIPAGDI
jgi:D-mannonate dehydratase